MLPFSCNNAHRQVICCVVSFVLVILIAPAALCETYRIALEPLPPFINKGFVNSDKPGISVKLLKAVEKKTGDVFIFSEVPYGRLKLGLRNRQYDLVGHMPYRNEVPDFYTYARDVDWHIDVAMDLYVTDKDNLKKINSLKIGIPRGNKDFAAKYTGLPIGLFYDKGGIESLLKMLVRGRIDAYWFPRASTVPFLNEMESRFYYIKLPPESLPIGFSVPDTERGRQLKKKVEEALESIDVHDLFHEIHMVNEMPDEGEIN